MKNLQEKRKGFTLIELIIVMAIIGILMLLTVPRFMNMTEGARIRTFESNHRSLVSAYATYVADNNGNEPDDIYLLMDDRGNTNNPLSGGTPTFDHMIEDLNDDGTNSANPVPVPVGARYEIMEEDDADTYAATFTDNPISSAVTPATFTSSSNSSATPPIVHYAIVSTFTRGNAAAESRIVIFSPVTGTVTIDEKAH